MFLELYFQNMCFLFLNFFINDLNPLLKQKKSEPVQKTKTLRSEIYKPEFDSITGNQIINSNLGFTNNIDFVQMNPNKTSVTIKNIDFQKETYHFDYIFEGPIESRLDKLSTKT